MQDFSIIRESQIKETFRTNAIKGKFDLDIPVVSEKFEGKINIPETWNIGLVVGNSGTGKTTIAKELFGGNFIESFGYDNGSVVDKMPKKVSVNEITKIFNSVGFSSVPSWLKPYHVLSNGEKMRVDLARAILEDRPFFVFDEFTSVVDRNVAKIGSHAMQKAIRRADKKFIAVTPHFDVEDWLCPDWVFDTNKMEFRLSNGKKKDQKSTPKLESSKTPKKKNLYGKNLENIII